ncbi:MAG: hypothetical protein L0H55_11705, partial [Candidatus Nitrosocosmicus sp.]|nr:hypothetical protein [Candidatus Nitrosocosmicus sp.]
HSNNLFSSDKKNKLIYSCYLCGLETDSKEEYERHYVRTHPGKPAYPCLADITKYGLEPQGKSWE